MPPPTNLDLINRSIGPIAPNGPENNGGNPPAPSRADIPDADSLSYFTHQTPESQLRNLCRSRSPGETLIETRNRLGQNGLLVQEAQSTIDQLRHACPEVETPVETECNPNAIQEIPNPDPDFWENRLETQLDRGTLELSRAENSFNYQPHANMARRHLEEATRVLGHFRTTGGDPEQAQEYQEVIENLKSDLQTFLSENPSGNEI